MARVLITGANRGIGLAMTRCYGERGDEVVATARRPDDAAELQELAAAHKDRIDIKALDVGDEASIAAFASSLGERALDVVVNNAGRLNSYGGLGDPAHTLEAWQEVLLVNVTGPYLVTCAILENLRRAPASKLVFISSTMASSERAPGGAYPYRASKAAVTNIARNMSSELRPENIAVAAYHPGWVRTEMGGSSADISVEESAVGLVSRIDVLSMATSGVFEDYQGVPMAF